MAPKNSNNQNNNEINQQDVRSESSSVLNNNQYNLSVPIELKSGFNIGKILEFKEKKNFEDTTANTSENSDNSGASGNESSNENDENKNEGEVINEITEITENREQNGDSFDEAILDTDEEEDKDNAEIIEIIKNNIAKDNIGKKNIVNVNDLEKDLPKIIAEEKAEAGYAQGRFISLSAIQKLVFRARYVVTHDDDITCLDDKYIWMDQHARKFAEEIFSENDSLANELEGYYMTKCKPVANLPEQDIQENKKYNLKLLYQIASLLDVKKAGEQPEDTITYRVSELDNIVATSTSFQFNTDQTFDFLDNIFKPSTENNSNPLNVALVGKNSEVQNNEFIPTVDEEFKKNRELINSIRLVDLKDQTNLSNETISAIVAGCFFRPDVLGSTYEQTFNPLENAFQPLPQKQDLRESERFDTMVDTFFTFTAGGDKRRSANIPLLAVPKARQMARFALGNLTQLSDKRAVVEALENVIRVAGKYAMMHTQNDHALYAASKLVNDAMIALDMPQFREISTLSAQERNMARGVSNLYLANVDLIKLNYELHDALLDYRTNDAIKIGDAEVKKPIKNDDVKRVFDSIYVRRHYIESHLKMAAQYGDKMRPLTSEELTCALNPAKYFDSLIKGSTIQTPKDIDKAKNIEEFKQAFDTFNQTPIPNAQIYTISSAEYNKKLINAMNAFAFSSDLKYCIDNSDALQKFFSKLDKGLRPISSDLLSSYEIKTQKDSIHALKEYLQFESPYSNPFGQLILGTHLKNTSNIDEKFKNKKIKEPYTLEHFSYAAKQYLYEGNQKGNLKRIKGAVKDFVKELDELESRLNAVEASRLQETAFIEDCLKDPDKPLGPDIEAQFKKKGIEGVSRSAMISKSYKQGQSLGLSELLIHLQETYKSSPKSLIVKRSLAEAKNNNSIKSGSETASRATRQSRQSKAVQSIRSFVSTRSDMSSVSRADNSYAISLEELVVLKDDLSVDKTVSKNETLTKEVQQLKAAKNNEQNKGKKKSIKKGPSTNWGAKLDLNAGNEPSQLDLLSDLSKDTSVKILTLSKEEQDLAYKEVLRKKLEMDTQKIKESIELKYGEKVKPENAGKLSNDFEVIKEEDEDAAEEDEELEDPKKAENKKPLGKEIKTVSAPESIDIDIAEAEFDANAALQSIQQQYRQEEPKDKDLSQAEITNPKALYYFSKTTSYIKPIDGALITINACLNQEAMDEQQKLAIQSIQPVLEQTKRYYEEFKDVILSGTNGLDYLFDKTGKPSMQFVTMELCRRLFTNSIKLPQKGSGQQPDYHAFIESISQELAQKYDYNKFKEEGRIPYQDIVLPYTKQGIYSEELKEEAFRKIAANAIEPERINKLKEIPNPGIQYIVQNAETLYTKLKNTEFSAIESKLVKNNVVSLVPHLDYITMRLFSNINNNYDKYAENPNLFNIHAEIDKIETELANLKNTGEVFQITHENISDMFGVEQPAERVIRQTNEKFALKKEALKLKTILNKALPLCGKHYQKVLSDGIKCIDNFTSEIAEFGQNRITTDLTLNLTHITTIPATASTGTRKVRHAHVNLVNIQAAINLVQNIVKNNEFDNTFDFENATEVRDERRKIESGLLERIDQAGNPDEDFAISLYSDMFQSVPEHIEKHIDALNNGLKQKKAYRAYMEEVHEKNAKEKREQEEKARREAEEKYTKTYNTFRESFDQNIFANKDEMLTRLKAQKYLCDEIMERLDTRTFNGSDDLLRKLIPLISRNCDTLISNIQNNVSVFDVFVNEQSKTVNRNYAFRRLFTNAISVKFDNEISIECKLLNGKSDLAYYTRDYENLELNQQSFRKNISFLPNLEMEQIQSFIKAREEKVYKRSPEYKEKVQNAQRIEELLKIQPFDDQDIKEQAERLAEQKKAEVNQAAGNNNKPAEEKELKVNDPGYEIAADLGVLKNIFDTYGNTKTGNAAVLAQQASQILDKVIADVRNQKPVFTSLVDKKNAKLSEDGAVLFTALDLFKVVTDADAPTLYLPDESITKYRVQLSQGFGIDNLSFTVPETKLFTKLLQPETIRTYNTNQKKLQKITEAKEKKLNSPISTREDIIDLKNILIENTPEIVNALTVQKIALDKVLSYANNTNYSQELKDLAKLGSDACVELIRNYTKGENIVKSVITNKDGIVTFSDNLSILEYCKKAFSVKSTQEGVIEISRKQDFNEDEIKGKSKDTLKSDIIHAESPEKSLSFKQIDDSLTGWTKKPLLKFSADDVDAERLSIDEAEHYERIFTGADENGEQNAVNPQNPNAVVAENREQNAVNLQNQNDFAAEKMQLRTLAFNGNSRQRFFEAFNTMKRELLKQDAWYHKNSDKYNNVIGKLNAAISAMQNASLNKEEKLLGCYVELNDVCETYLAKTDSTKFITTWGYNRYRQISELQEIVKSRVDSVYTEKYKDAIAEKLTQLMLEKTTGNRPTPQQILAQAPQMKKNPVFKAVIEKKNLEELQQLAMENKALKSAVIGYAKTKDLLKIKDVNKDQITQEEEALAPIKK